MANYIFLVASELYSSKIKRWIDDPDARWSRFGSADCLYLARGSENDRLGKGIFKGCAVDHAGRRLIFSGAGIAPNTLEPLEGCYLRIQEHGGAIAVGNDLFAQLTLLYFAAPGVVAVSDSLAVLTELRKHLGLRNVIDEEVMLARSWNNSMAAQLLCGRTPIRDIRFASLGTRLVIEVRGGEPSLSVTKTPAADIFTATIAGYRDTVIEGAERAIALIATLLSISGSRVTLGWSGGVDSRVCLAACLAADKTQRVDIRSNVRRLEDFAVVKAISGRFGFAVNKPLKHAAGLPIDRLGAWFLSNCGIYDPLYVPFFGPEQGPIFTVGGHGAELYKGYYGWRSISRIAAGVPDVGKIFRAQCSDGLMAMGIDQDDPWGSEWHYLGYRNAIHSGRFTMSSMRDVRPLLQRELLGLSHSPLNEFPAPKKAEPSIVTDLLIALSPELALEPFDLEKKNLDKSFVTERSTYLGRVGKAEPYEVIGAPSDVESGPSHFFHMIAARNGTSGALSAANVAPLLNRAMQRVPGSIIWAFEPLFGLALGQLGDPVSAGARPSMAAGKMMAFLLAD